MNPDHSREGGAVIEKPIRQAWSIWDVLSLLLFCLSGLQIAVANEGRKFVEDEGMTSAVHENSVGRLVFTNGLVRPDEQTPSRWLDSFVLSPDENLAFTAFFDASLTNELHQLDTALSPAELVKIGNYEFSFFIDGEHFYTEQLNPGAGLAADKNSNTVLMGPLHSNRQEDYWSRFLWARFFFREGGATAFEDGTRQLRIEVRPYLQQGDQITVGDLMAAGEIALSFPQPEDLETGDLAVAEIAQHRDWEASDAPFDAELIKQLKTKIAQQQFRKITSLVVVRDGKLLVEEYFNGAGRETLHDTRSVGKTFASALAGIAIRDGYIKSVDQTLSDFYRLAEFANPSATKENVSLKSLLTMSSGFAGSDQNSDTPGNEEKMYPTDNWVEFALNLPMDSAKTMGETWDYFTAGVVVLGDVLHRSVPGGLETYAEKRLFAPLGITQLEWQYTPQGVVNTAGGLQLSSLDLAKFGQLYKNGGSWYGTQILPSGWVKDSLTDYFAADDNPMGYGYLFWKQQYAALGSTYEAFAASGNGGNKVFIFTKLPLVVVVTATAYNEPYAHSQVDRMMQEFVLPAVLHY